MPSEKSLISEAITNYLVLVSEGGSSMLMPMSNTYWMNRQSSKLFVWVDSYNPHKKPYEVATNIIFIL